MQINNLKLSVRRKKRKVVGRGGKRGTYATRGIKGQKSRSGASIDPLFEGGRSTLVDHMKKKRGFTSHKSFKNNINISQLEKNFKDGETVGIESLVEKGILDKRLSKNGVKILCQKENKLSKKLTIEKNIGLSASSKKMIEEIGGKVLAS